MSAKQDETRARNLAKRWQTPESRAAAAERMRKRWADKAWREFMAAQVDTDEARAAKSVAAQQSWANPEIRAKRVANMSATLKGVWSSPEQRARHSAVMRRVYSNPAALANLAAGLRISQASRRRANGADVQSATKVVRKRYGAKVSSIPIDPMEAALFGVAVPQSRAAALEERSDSARDAVRAVG